MPDESEQCPKCGGSSIAAILYGLPDMNDELERCLEMGAITLGGCVVDDDSPEWHCNECGHEFGKLDG